MAVRLQLGAAVCCRPSHSFYRPALHGTAHGSSMTAAFTGSNCPATRLITHCRSLRLRLTPGTQRSTRLLATPLPPPPPPLLLLQPITIMRNALGREEGGSGVPLERDAYEAATAYWNTHAQIQ